MYLLLRFEGEWVDSIVIVRRPDLLEDSSKRKLALLHTVNSTAKRTIKQN